MRVSTTTASYSPTLTNLGLGAELTWSPIRFDIDIAVFEI